MNLPRMLLTGLQLVLSLVVLPSASQAAGVSSFADDARLDKPVTISADGTRLDDVLAQLAESTGVTLSAGLDKNDWMVYDRKLILYVNGMKMRDLMREIGSTLRFHWSRGGEKGKWTYRLWQDEQERAEERSLREGAQDSQARKLREQRENAIADMANLGSLSAQDAGELKTTSPWRYILATEPLGRDVAEFVTQFPDARNAIAQGTEASFPVASLPTQVQDTVQRIAFAYDSLAKSIGASEDHTALINRFDRLQITINRRNSLPGAATDVFSRSTLGRIMIGDGAEALEIPLLDPSSEVGRAFGAAILDLKSGKPKETVARELQSAMTAAANAPVVDTAPARDITSDPSLRAPVSLFGTATKASLGMALKALAEKSKLTIISDCFPGPPVSIAAGEKPLGEQLELIRTGFGSNWEKAGGILRFHDSEWFKKRAWEIPQVWLDYWVARGKVNNGFLLQDLVQIGSLRDEQIDHTVMLNQMLVDLGAGDASRNRQILRFYSSLGKEHKDALVGKQLMVSDLSDPEWATLQQALATKGAAYAAATRGAQFVKLTQSGSEIVDYIFAYYPGPNEGPIEFKVSTGLTFRRRDEVQFPSDPPAQKAPQPAK